MTILSSKFGEDWTSYLQAVVFSYNSSTCASTGYSPYYLMFGKDPTLLEDIALEHVHDEQTEDIANITTRLTAAYKHVRAQQRRMAEINRQRIAKQRNNKAEIKYEIGDPVMYWEPAQTKHLLLKDDEINITKKAPSKWKDRWTGPHTIVAIESGKYNPRYTIDHVKWRRKITSVKADKLAPYHPWNETLPSPSTDLDTSDQPFKIGTWCDKDSLFIIPLAPPWPFGVGKVLEAKDDGSIKYQWYRSNNYQGTSPFLPMWWDGKRGYHAEKRKKSTHKPYDGDINGEEWNLEVTQSDIVFHSFELTKTHRLPKVVQTACKEHSDIWWPKKE
jgi:hypothetical protein